MQSSDKCVQSSTQTVPVDIDKQVSACSCHSVLMLAQEVAKTSWLNGSVTI